MLTACVCVCVHVYTMYMYSACWPFHKIGFIATPDAVHAHASRKCAMTTSCAWARLCKFTSSIRCTTYTCMSRHCRTLVNGPWNVMCRLCMYTCALKTLLRVRPRSLAVHCRQLLWLLHHECIEIQCACAVHCRQCTCASYGAEPGGETSHVVCVCVCVCACVCA